MTAPDKEKDNKIKNKVCDTDGKQRKEKSAKKNKIKPLTRVVIRRLPPTMTEEDFLKQIDPLPKYESYYFVPADWSLGFDATCRAYINFISQNDVFWFKDRFDGYVFVDNKGAEYPAIVEFAAFQGLPKAKCRKNDLKSNTIEHDPHYKKFLKKVEDDESDEVGKSDSKLEILFTLKEDKKNMSTPLLQYLANKKQEKKEERKRKIELKKRQREEDKRSKKIQIAKSVPPSIKEEEVNKRNKNVSTSVTASSMQNKERDKDLEYRDKDFERRDKDFKHRDKDSERRDRDSKYRDKDLERRDRDFERHDRVFERRDRDFKHRDKDPERCDRDFERRDRDRERRDRDRERRDRDRERYQKDIYEERKDSHIKDQKKKEHNERQTMNSGSSNNIRSQDKIDQKKDDYKIKINPLNSQIKHDRQDRIDCKERRGSQDNLVYKKLEMGTNKTQQIQENENDKQLKKQYVSVESIEKESQKSNSSIATEVNANVREFIMKTAANTKERIFQNKTATKSSIFNKNDCKSEKTGYAANNMKHNEISEYDRKCEERTSRRIRNKDRPSIEIYQPGKMRLTSKRDERNDKGRGDYNRENRYGHSSTRNENENVNKEGSENYII